MNSVYTDWLLFAKERVVPADMAKALAGYDRFISCHNASQRVCDVFGKIPCGQKHGIVLAEYQLDDHLIPATGERFRFTSLEENEVIQDYFDQAPIRPSERVCIDSTGFLRPHLLFTLRYLYELGVDQVDMIYSEPESYSKGLGTQFSFPISEVRPVRGYEGCHEASLDSSGEYLIVGCGYDTDLMHAIANTHKQANKIQMFPFPPLRPHMYQENRVKTLHCHEAFGRVIEQCFAPGYDPFSTAQVLQRVVAANAPNIRNLYLTPLATKPQVIGFGLYYLTKWLGKAGSIVFPFSDRYNQETSKGLSEIWRYQIDFRLLKSVTA